MGWTKKQFIDQALEEIGIAPYVFDITPEQYDSALRTMDGMVAGWNANGVRINYPLSITPQSSDLNADSGVPDYANEAIWLNLACRLAPRFGKQVSPETKQFADAAYAAMANQVAMPIHERQMPGTMPRGQGTKPWRNFNNPFCYRPSDNTIDAGGDGELDLN